MEDNFKFCYQCGGKLQEKIETVFCPYCGEKVETEGEFCPFCGKALNEEIDSKQVDVEKVESKNKDLTEIKQSLIAFLYLCGLVIWFFMYRSVRTYYIESELSSMGFEKSSNVLSLENVFIFMMLGYILLFVLYFVIKYLNVGNVSKLFVGDVSKIFLGVISCVIASVTGAFFGINVFISIFVVAFIFIILLMTKITLNDEDLKKH